MKPIFITGIGTGIGKTLVAAIVTEALQADYWKPIQAGFEDGTDALTVKGLLSNDRSVVHEEMYKLQMPASPHIAARHQGVEINLEEIVNRHHSFLEKDTPLVIEGAGGITVPLSATHFVSDLIKMMDARVILVSRNYLGSINHSLLTAAYCTTMQLDVAGWIFNDQYLQYEAEIAYWSGYPAIGSIPATTGITKAFVQQQAALIKDQLITLL